MNNKNSFENFGSIEFSTCTVLGFTNLYHKYVDRKSIIVRIDGPFRRNKREL